MKPLKFLTLLFLLCLYLKGQSQDAELIDSNQFNLSYKIMVDSCLKNVNLDSVPYGILLEKEFYKTQSISFDQNTNNRCNETF